MISAAEQGDWQPGEANYYIQSKNIMATLAAKHGSFFIWALLPPGISGPGKESFHC